MPTPNDIIVNSLTGSQMLLHRYVDDLQPAEFLHRTSPKANCAAWMIGHLVQTDRRVLTVLGVTDLPALPDGFEQRFGRDEATALAANFGDVSTLMPLFDQHRARLIDAIRRASAEQLDKPVETTRPMFKTVGEFANFMGMHTALHAGQITLIRRSLGKPPVV